MKKKNRSPIEVVGGQLSSMVYEIITYLTVSDIVNKIH